MSENHIYSPAAAVRQTLRTFFEQDVTPKVQLIQEDIPVKDGPGAAEFRTRIDQSLKRYVELSAIGKDEDQQHYFETLNVPDKGILTIAEPATWDRVKKFALNDLNTTDAVLEIFKDKKPAELGSQLVRRDIALPAWDRNDPYFIDRVVASLQKLNFETMTGIKQGQPIMPGMDLSPAGHFVVLRNNGLDQQHGEAERETDWRVDRGITVIAASNAWDKIREAALKQYDEPVSSNHPVTAAWRKAAGYGARQFGQIANSLRHPINPLVDEKKIIHEILENLFSKGHGYFQKNDDKRLVRNDIYIGGMSPGRTEHLEKLIGQLSTEALGEVSARNVQTVRTDQHGLAVVATPEAWAKLKQYTEGRLEPKFPAQALKLTQSALST